MRALAVIFLTLPGVALAECPAVPDIDADEASLLEQVQETSSEMEARILTGRLWALWSTAPDEASQELLDRGMNARSSYDFLAALDAFNRLVDYCPHYAEGYNQRAFVNFLREDFAAALDDLDRALARRPTHVAALSGKAMTLMGLGRHDEAQLVLREALALNPWIPERSFLREPVGDEL